METATTVRSDYRGDVGRKGFPAPRSGRQNTRRKTVYDLVRHRHQLRQNGASAPRAGISFFDRGDSVALTGTAEEIEYPAVKKIMWQEWFIKHFPGGVEDPEYCLVRFEARKGVFYIEDKFVKSVSK